MHAVATISPEIVRLIQEMLLGCEQCSLLAQTPFDQFLHNLSGYGEGKCLLLELAHCPCCGAAISGKTLVETD